MFRAKASGVIGLMLDLVPMAPLIPGQVTRLDKQAFGPTLAVAVALLELAPGGRQEPSKQVLPANCGLGGGGLVDLLFGKVGGGK